MFPLINVVAYFFPPDSCSNEFFPSRVSLCVPLRRKQTLKPEGQLNLLICSNLKHRPQAVAALLLHRAQLSAWLPRAPRKAFPLTCVHLGARNCRDAAHVQCSCMRAGIANLLPQLQVSRLRIQGQGLAAGRGNFFLYLVI